MAQRRMFSLRIVDTDDFLAMPISTRLLYYDLSMRADDDGFVGSPKKIMKIIGATEDDFKVLIAKRYIFHFENGVCVIRDWKIHNYIQSDRKQKTLYQNEMKKLMVEKDGSYFLPHNQEPVMVASEFVSKMDTECIQNVSILDTQVRLGKVRLEIEKGSLSNQNMQNMSANRACDSDESRCNNEISKNSVPYKQIIELFHRHLSEYMPEVKIITDERKRKIKARWVNELKTIEDWDKYFSKVTFCDFLIGKKLDRNGETFRCSIDWLICPRNVAKVLEGNYV